ncbi:MAG: glycosyltransferase family 4 protein [Flavobacteriales bacterium]|nr:glycosyltransferase family 4 protein [Flavobacteriales bacterium]
MRERTNGPRRPRLFFTDRGDASFILRDLGMLKGFTDVRRYSFKARQWDLPFRLLQALLVSLREVPQCDLVVCQFGGWNAWIPLQVARWWGKPAVLVVHGTDCVSLPSIGYGNFRKWPLRAVTARCMRLATRILPVHESLVLCENDYATGVMTRQGIQAYLGGAHAPVTVLHHGFDATWWTTGPEAARSGFLTVVAGSGSPTTRALKGVDLLLECARAFPEERFSIVGPGSPDMEGLPDNVRFLGPLSPEELKRLYQSHRFYLQLSMSEGFGCALAEAMLCGCVPITSSAGSLPDIAGDTGYVLKQRDLAELVTLIRSAMEEPQEGRSARARQWIVERFPVPRRMEGWRVIIDALIRTCIARG